MTAASALDDVGRHARTNPAREALVDLASGHRWTYAALDRAVGQAVSVLVDYNCAQGDRVAVLSRNRAELVILQLACARMGAIFVPLNWRLSDGEIGDLLEDAGPRILFADGARDSFAREIVSIRDFAAAVLEAEADARMATSAHQASLILYTSGTSGRPKGVVHSEASLAETAQNFAKLGEVTPDSVFLIDAPMFHVIGIVTSVRPTLLQGATILVSDGFDAARTLQRLGDPTLAVTHYFCVPQMAAALRALSEFDPAPLRKLTAIFTGGAPHAAEAVRAWIADDVALSDGYGMTEAGTVFGMPTKRDVIEAKAGSAGLAPSRVETRIVDAAGADCADDQPGELLLRGPNLTSGYWGKADETAAAFTADGWFRTGDIVRRDCDGFHFIVDRKKDMYISGGENVYPAEIEAALADVEGLAEAAVIGVPDERWGEAGVCVYVAKSGCVVDADALQAHLETKLARYKQPKRFVALDALPRTGSGKIQKHVLRTLILADQD